MINVYVISGFLGSGKTTLIQKLINDKVFVKPMLIENEFGEVGIDDLLLKDSLEVIGINSGCICCSLKGDLKKALDTIKSYDIDSLIIEPSGVGKLSEINKTIVADKDLKLVFDVAMVDAKKALSYHRNFKEFFDDQIIMADTIVLSKTEDLDDAKKAEVVGMLKELNDEALIIEEAYLKMDSKKLFALFNEHEKVCEACSGCLDDEELLGELKKLKEDLDHHHHDHHDHHHHHHDADEVFISEAYETSNSYDEDELQVILKALKEEVVRAKGFLKGKDHDWYFDISGDDIALRRCQKIEKGIIVVIAHDLNEKKVKELFKL